MDPAQLAPQDLSLVAPASAPLAGFNGQAGAAQAVYRETLEAPPVRRGVDLANDLRATAGTILNLERTMSAERLRMFQSLTPNVALGGLGAAPGVATDGRGRELEVVTAGGRSVPRDVAYGGALDRDSDRVSFGAQPLYSDAPSSVPRGLMAPLVQNAFGAPDGTDPRQIDFAAQLESLDRRSIALMEQMANAQRGGPEEPTLEDNMRQFQQFQALAREQSNVITSKNVIANLYVGVYEEFRNKALVAVTLIQSSFNKVNQVFNQLKSGS
jgi:hypothetical protein